MRHTKIMCTLGPSSNNYALIRSLVRGGMDAARFNVSHGTHAEHLARLRLLRKASAAERGHIAAVLDTKGPEVRSANVSPIELRAGKILLVGKSAKADIPLTSFLWKYAVKGDRILIDDGKIEMRVISSGPDGVSARVVVGGVLKPRKTIAIPGKRFTMPFLSNADREDLRFAAKNGFDHVAASFTRSAADVRLLRSFLRSLGSRMRIIAKIENHEGVANIDAIIAEADGVMVARGDLGIEYPMEEVPAIQKMIVRKCVAAGKPAIVATQMLETMVDKPCPTRAETSDIANAVWQGASAVMLSAETAAGSYPLQALRTMALTAESAERAIGRPLRPDRKPSVTDAISGSVAALAEFVGVKAVVCFTSSGATARLVSKERLRVPVVALTPRDAVARSLALDYGVVPVVTGIRIGEREMAAEARRAAAKIAGKGLVLATYGTRGLRTGCTDTIKVLEA